MLAFAWRLWRLTRGRLGARCSPAPMALTAHGAVDLGEQLFQDVLIGGQALARQVQVRKLAPLVLAQLASLVTSRIGGLLRGTRLLMGTHHLGIARIELGTRASQCRLEV